MNFVVLEGLDGVGKTTLAQRWQHEHGLVYHHVGPPGEGGDFPTLAQTWWEATSRYPHVWDRGHLGEDVYGPVRRGTRLTRAARNVLRFLLADRAAAVLWLDLDPVELGILDPVLEMALAERSQMRQAVRNFHYPVYHLQSREAAEEWWSLHAMEIGERPGPRDAWGIGSPQPAILVLGEQASRAASCSLPFFTASGMALIWEVVQDHERIRVSNVLPPDAPLFECRRSPREPWLSGLRQRWEWLGEPQVVALGSTAERWCRAAAIPVMAELAHPQYIWRFEHAATNHYREQLRRCLR